ncbi:MAG TPA: DUF4242 domain-containing protein [Azospirillaceae bacterium]|nr:DUF4242 domain-containing protein [Azospirillaceae bacterium]
MRRFIVERDMPGIGQVDSTTMGTIARTSCDAQREVGADVQWVESYIADNKTYCVYMAENAEVVRRHGEIAGFPITAIREVRGMLDPTMAA